MGNGLMDRINMVSKVCYNRMAADNDQFNFDADTGAAPDKVSNVFFRVVAPVVQNTDTGVFIQERVVFTYARKIAPQNFNMTPFLYYRQVLIEILASQDFLRIVDIGDVVFDDETTQIRVDITTEMT